jgi:hypothetical protein
MQGGVNVLAVVLGFHHPSIDPTTITNTLQLTPTTSALKGARYVTVTGELSSSPAVHRTSKWALYRDLSAADAEADDGLQILDDLLKTLEAHAPFVRRLANEGHAWIGLQFAGRTYRGMELSTGILQRISALDMAFGIEIFPSGLS